MVLEERLELSRDFSHYDLNVARLPIPPPEQGKYFRPIRYYFSAQSQSFHHLFVFPDRGKNHVGNKASSGYDSLITLKEYPNYSLDF